MKKTLIFILTMIFASVSFADVVPLKESVKGGTRGVDNFLWSDYRTAINANEADLDSRKADKSTTYTKTEVDALVSDISTKADAATTYTKTEVDTAIENVSVGGTTIEADGVDNTKAAKAVLADGLAPGADLNVASITVTSVDGQNGLRGATANTPGSVTPLSGEYGLVPMNDGTWWAIIDGVLSPIVTGPVDAYTKAEVDALIALVSNGSDVIAPVVELGSDLTHDGTGTTFEITSAMVTEANLDTVEYDWDGGPNVEISLPFTVTVPANTEDHTLNVTATDLSALIGSDAISFLYSGGAQTFDYQVDFEEAGAPTVGSWAGTGSYNYDDTVNPMEDSQSLNMLSPDADITWTISDYSTMYACVPVRVDVEVTGSTNAIYIKNASGVDLYRIIRLDTGFWRIRNESTYEIVSSTTSIPVGDTGYLFIKVVADSGSNDGSLTLWPSVSKTRGSEFITSGANAIDGLIGKMWFRANTDLSYHVDAIKVDQSEFTTIP